MAAARRFFVRVGKNQFEVVWRLNPFSGIHHAIRPNGSITACGKKQKLVEPAVEDPSDCPTTCLACAESVIRIVGPAKEPNLKKILRQMSN